MATLDISGLFFFMPVFSFLFVFVVVYAILAKTKVLGDQRVNLLVSFIIAIIFMNFSSLDLYVRTILPWFVVLLVCLFLALVIIGFSTKDFEKMTTPGFAWVVVAILVIIFLIAAIRVFNPMFHPELGITTAGDGQQGVLVQIMSIFDSQVGGSVLLLIIGLIAAWVLTKK
ncbi:MAG: hypothetical protein WC979_05125 [Candidatus Pacearchaeota archaeon]|jgi:hypothetical protein